MSPHTPQDRDKLSLQPSKSAGTGSGKPDFSNVSSHADTVRGGADGGGGSGGKADFSNVQGHADTVPGNTAGAQQSYTVQKGDTLSAIAQRHYGKASRWHAIFDANRDLLDDPDRIQPGQVLKLPPAND